MQTYAILSKESDSVLNIVNVESEEFVFVSPDEYYVPATRSVQVGMVYDKVKKEFPGVKESDDLLDLQDQIKSLIEKHSEYVTNVIIIGEEDKDNPQLHLNYIESLKTILNSSGSYSQVKSQFDALVAPVFLENPKLIDQDLFRSLFKINEKLLWDNPEIGTSAQKAAIITVKMSFPFYGISSMIDELDLLESVEFTTPTRIAELKQLLA